MRIKILENKFFLGKAAANEAAEVLKNIINKKGEATFVVATGRSQIEFLDNITKIPFIDWSKTTMFHLDEYVGLPITHYASFRKYLKDKLINKVHPK